jgi:hypothetical protein
MGYPLLGLIHTTSGNFKSSFQEQCFPLHQRLRGEPGLPVTPKLPAIRSFSEGW